MYTLKTKLSRRFIVNITVFAVLLSLITLLQTKSLTVHAASVSINPSVLIVVDATKTGCILDLSANINTKHPSTVHIPCPAGTIMRTEKVSLSQALAKHENYVLLPSEPISKIVFHKLMQELEQIKQGKQHQLQANLKQSSLSPSTNCGNEGSGGIDWLQYSVNDTGSSRDPAAYFHAYVKETFYILPSPNCNSAALETASMQVYATVTNFDSFRWQYDKYAGRTFGVPYGGSGWPLQGGTSYSHSVNSNYPKGYTYEEWVQDDEYTGTYYWCDIPIR